MLRHMLFWFSVHGRDDTAGSLLPEPECEICLFQQWPCLRLRWAARQCIDDIGVMRALPNMTVITPADYYSARKLVRESAEICDPICLRFTRDSISQIYDSSSIFTIGKATHLREGKDVAIIAAGDAVIVALRAAEVLASGGIGAGVSDMHTIKPLDVGAVAACVNDIGKIKTVEDHNIINGLESAVCEVAADMEEWNRQTRWCAR